MFLLEPRSPKNNRKQPQPCRPPAQIYRPIAVNMQAESLAGFIRLGLAVKRRKKTLKMPYDILRENTEI